MVFLSPSDTLVLTSSVKATPYQTYNDTIAMHIGREFDLEKVYLPLTSCHQEILRIIHRR